MFQQLSCCFAIDRGGVVLPMRGLLSSTTTTTWDPRMPSISSSTRDHWASGSVDKRTRITVFCRFLLSTFIYRRCKLLFFSECLTVFPDSCCSITRSILKTTIKAHSVLFYGYISLKRCADSSSVWFLTSSDLEHDKPSTGRTQPDL